jgi:hypothetical protein
MFRPVALLVPVLAALGLAACATTYVPPAAPDAATPSSSQAAS